jgi:hypothetical protein
VVTVQWTNATLALLLIQLGLSSCRKPVDRSRPEALAQEMVRALNNGDLNGVKRVVGDDFLTKRRQECLAIKEKPAPEPPTERTGAIGGLLMANYEVYKRRFEADCNKIETNFKELLKQAEKSPGYSVLQVRKRSTPDKVVVEVKPPAEGGTDSWSMEFVGGKWQLEEEFFGWPEASLDYSGTNLWLAGLRLNEALGGQ